MSDLEYQGVKIIFDDELPADRFVLIPHPDAIEMKPTMAISNVNQLIAFLSWVLAKHGNVMVIGEYGADIEVTYHDGLEVEEPAVLIKEVIRG